MNKEMRILYLSYDGINDPLGQSQILPYLKGLAVKGHEITVVSFEKPSFAIASEDTKSKIRDRKSEIGENLYSIKLSYHKSPPVLSTLYDIWKLKQAVKKIIEEENIDIIHCRSYITSLIGLWAKRKYGTKFIFDMRGFWADERVEGGLWNLKNPVFKQIYNYFKKKELQFLKEADAVISLTNNAKNYILSSEALAKEDPTSKNTKSDHLASTHTHINPSILSVIPTCTDLSHFNPSNISNEETLKLRNELGISSNDFVLLYLGSLGTWYMLDEMLEFFHELKVEGSKLKGVNFRFLFLTKDQEILQQKLSFHPPNHSSTHQLIQSPTHPPIYTSTHPPILIHQASRSEVPAYISLCNAGIFFIKPTFSKKASAATKMGELMAMGKPVITNTSWGDVEPILNKTKAGALVESFDKKGYQNAIEQFFSLDFSATLIRKQAENNFSLEEGIKKYDDIYQKLLLPKQ